MNTPVIAVALAACAGTTRAIAISVTRIMKNRGATGESRFDGIVTLLGLWAGICGRKCPS